jgi:hypothetical protein
MLELTAEEKEAVYCGECYTDIPVPEYTCGWDRMRELFEMVLLDQKKPDDLTIAESATWDRLVEEVVEEGPVRWYIPQ